MPAIRVTAPPRLGGHLSPVLTGEDRPLASIIRRHLATLQLRGQTPDTIYCRRRNLVRLAAALPVPLLDATAADLAAWRAGLSVGPSTVVGYVSHAREFYAWAVADGLLEENPAAALPVPPLPRRLPRPIGEQDLFAAVADAPGRIRPWLVLAGWAGLRAKEIAGLRRENVLDRVSPPLLIVAHDATKGRTERAVPLCAFALRALLEAGLPAAGWVFRRRDGQPGANRPWIISHLCNAYLHECGISATLHQLRHRFGTRVYAVDHDLRLTQELLGHANVATTAGYAAIDQADAAEVVEQLPVPSLLPRLRTVL